jgi:hypothetical protein
MLPVSTALAPSIGWIFDQNSELFELLFPLNGLIKVKCVYSPTLRSGRGPGPTHAATSHTHGVTARCTALARCASGPAEAHGSHRPGPARLPVKER